jgi:hypothetical protein
MVFYKLNLALEMLANPGLDSVGSLTSLNPIGLHDLLWGSLYCTLLAFSLAATPVDFVLLDARGKSTSGRYQFRQQLKVFPW